MSVTYTDASPRDPITLKSPLIFLVSTLGFGFLFTLPVFWDYQYYQKALPYQAYVLYDSPHYSKGSVDYYELHVQYQPPQQAVRQAALRTDKDYPTGQMMPIVYDPNRGGECREYKPKMSFGSEVFPAFLVRSLIAAVLTLLFEAKAWLRKLRG